VKYFVIIKAILLQGTGETGKAGADRYQHRRRKLLWFSLVSFLWVLAIILTCISVGIGAIKYIIAGPQYEYGSQLITVSLNTGAAVQTDPLESLEDFDIIDSGS